MFAVNKNAGFKIDDNGDKNMESVEVEFDTIEDMERLISVVNCSVVVSIVGRRDNVLWQTLPLPLHEPTERAGVAKGYDTEV